MWYVSRNLSGAAVLVVIVTIATTPAFGANDNLQDLFFAACVNPQANLAVRCQETVGGLGDLSSDSESSLNPSQGLSAFSGRRSAGEAQGDGVRNRIDAGASERVDSGPFSLIFNAYSGNAEFDRRVDLDSERGYERDDRAFDLGFDYRAGNRWVIGALAQVQQQELDFVAELPGVNFAPSGIAGRIDTDAFGIAAYASRSLGERGYLDISFSHTRAVYEFDRNALFQENTRTQNTVTVRTEGQTDGTENALHVAAGFAVERGGWDLQPFASLSWIQTDVDDYVEADVSNSGLAMAFEMSDSDTSLAAMGLRASRAFSFSGGVVVPTLRLQYTHPLQTDVPELGARYVNDLNAARLNLAGDELDDGYVDAALSLNFVLPGGWMPFAEFQITEGIEDLSRWRFAAGLRKEL